MDPKSQLLVFSRKEILVIIVLLLLVALFSFTLGLKLGRTLGSAQATHEETAPLIEQSPAPEPTAASTAEKSLMDDANVESAPVGGSSEGTKSQKAEDQADAQLTEEVSKGNVKTEKKVPMDYPSQKKTAGRFTLQVGAYRTIGEAAEQVALLKRQQLDAFYVPAQIPGKGTWYRVGIGLFATKEEADNTATELKATKTLPQFLIQKLND